MLDNFPAFVMDTSQLNELLECSVCLERLNETCKVLPCQHTFCKRCLKELVSARKELRCPECRSLVDDDVDDLPTNLFVVRLLESLRRPNQRPSASPTETVGTYSLEKANTQAAGSVAGKPCARVLYDYEAKESGDLSLTKGERVLLIKQVDENWLEGEVGSKQGYLPANYIEIITPLPTLDDLYRSPVAKALFDFEDETEQDLLKFKQGDIITVLQQVDSNWCEGRLKEQQGIFPVSFVEFNSAAKLLMERRGSLQDVESETARSSGYSSSADHSRQNSGDLIGSSNQPQNIITTSDLSQLQVDLRPVNSLAPVGTPHRYSSRPDTAGASSSRPNSAEIGGEMYIALYQYKPQKEDELELTQGESYCVTDKCKDGWFRGFCFSSQKRGVFPGNYVRLASLHNLLTKSKNGAGGQENPSLNQHEVAQPRPQSVGAALPQSRYRRSDSAPSFSQRNPPSLVVNLGPANQYSAGAINREDFSFQPSSPRSPPPPVPKSSGFWKKLKGKKKDKPQKPLPPPPPYNRELPTGHVPAASSRPHSHPEVSYRNLAPASPPPPYTPHASLPSYTETFRELRPRNRVENAPARERYRAVVAYPPQSEAELELGVGDIVYVSKRRTDGWFKGTLERNGRTGLFPCSFVEKF